MIEPANRIHPTAILDGDIVIGSGNVIEPYVVLSGNITIGDNNHIRAHSYLTNRVVIGDHNHIYPYVTIGCLGEMGAKGDRYVEDGQVRLGNYVTIREHVKVHSPVRTSLTEIEDHCYIMNQAYLAHDTRIGHHVVLSGGVLLGGRCEIHAFANVGMGAVLHQRVHVGLGAMVGMNSTNIKHVPPFATVAGCPSKILRINSMGFLRAGFSENELDTMAPLYRQLIEGKKLPGHRAARIMEEFLMKQPDSLKTFK